MKALISSFLCTGLIFSSLLSQVIAADLKLPGAEKKTAVTSADKLGTNENGMGLKAGDKVPAFHSNTYTGDKVSLEDLLDAGPIMVIFYRGGWCPFCNYQVRQVTQAFDQFTQRNVTPVLVSVDQTDGAMLVKDAYDIPFPVLSDSELAAHEAFNAFIEVDNSTYEKYKDYGIDLETWSGLTHHKIAAPAVFLVDKDANVRWSHVALDFKTRPSIEQLLSAIDSSLK